jgi:hypothetical protein
MMRRAAMKGQPSTFPTTWTTLLVHSRVTPAMTEKRCRLCMWLPPPGNVQ